MKHTFAILALALVAACSVQPRVMFWYGSEQHPVTDIAWLGDPKGSGETWSNFMSSVEFDITLAFVPGQLAALEATRNITYWFVDGQRAEGVRAFAPERTYLLATIRPATKHAGRLAACTVQILGGPLRGAIVCIKPWEWVKHPRDPSHAVFEVPEAVVLHPGYVPFRVVDFASK